MRKFFIFILVLVLAVCGWLAWALWTPVEPGGQKFVLLHPGYSTYRIAKELKAAGVIRSANAFVPPRPTTMEALCQTPRLPSSSRQ